MEAFLSFGKYNNFQSDNLLYNSEYSNFSYNFEKPPNEWVSSFLVKHSGVLVSISGI